MCVRARARAQPPYQRGRPLHAFKGTPEHSDPVFAQTTRELVSLDGPIDHADRADHVDKRGHQNGILYLCNCRVGIVDAGPTHSATALDVGDFILTSRSCDHEAGCWSFARPNGFSVGRFAVGSECDFYLHGDSTFRGLEPPHFFLVFVIVDVRYFRIPACATISALVALRWCWALVACGRFSIHA